MFGVTHALAQDDNSGMILACSTMLVKSNLIIYNNNLIIYLQQPPYYLQQHFRMTYGL